MNRTQVEPLEDVFLCPMTGAVISPKLVIMWTLGSTGLIFQIARLRFFLSCVAALQCSRPTDQLSGTWWDERVWASLDKQPYQNPTTLILFLTSKIKSLPGERLQPQKSRSTGRPMEINSAAC